MDTQMTLEEFAKDAGAVIQLNPEPQGWGGKWEFYNSEHPNCSYCGFKTEASAYKGFMEHKFGVHGTRAIIKLLKKVQRNTK